MKAIFFDVDDTLYDQTWPFKSAYKELYPLDITIDLDKLYKDEQIFSDLLLDDYYENKVSKEEMHIERIKRALKEQDRIITDEEAYAFQKCYEKFQNEIKMSQAMKDTLRELSEKWVLGAITNGISDNQWRKIRTLGLEEFIPEDHIFVSGDLPYAKPSKEIYEYATQKLGVTPQESYYVGDTFQKDVTGSENAGLTPIWFNRRDYQKEVKENLKIVFTEEELLETLNNLS